MVEFDTQLEKIALNEYPVVISRERYSDEYSDEECVKLEMIGRYFGEYAAVVVTERLWENYPDLPMPERAEEWLSGYRMMKNAEQSYMRVFLGAEVYLRKIGGGPYLIYGLEVEDVEWLMYVVDESSSLAELSQAVQKRGLLITKPNFKRDNCDVPIDERRCCNGYADDPLSDNAGSSALESTVENGVSYAYELDANEAWTGLGHMESVESSFEFGQWLKEHIIGDTLRKIHPTFFFGKQNEWL